MATPLGRQGKGEKCLRTYWVPTAYQVLPDVLLGHLTGLLEVGQHQCGGGTRAQRGTVTGSVSPGRRVKEPGLSLCQQVTR